MFDCHKTRGQQILWQKGWHVLGTTWIWHLWPRSWEIKLSYTWWLTLSLDPGYTIHQKTSAPSHISASLPAALRRSQTDIPPPAVCCGKPVWGPASSLEDSGQVEEFGSQVAGDADNGVVARWARRQGYECQVWVLDVGAIWCCFFSCFWLLQLIVFGTSIVWLYDMSIVMECMSIVMECHVLECSVM